MAYVRDSETEIEKPVHQAEQIAPGSSLPFGPRMYCDKSENAIRMKDIAVGRRIILMGVIGSFTPDCWNRHVFLAMKYYDYFQERGVDHICCISTNDLFVHSAWGNYIGLTGKVMMLSDPFAEYTRALGMGFILPWMDNRIRSKRYLLQADDMMVVKMIKCDRDIYSVRWDCDHLLTVEDEKEEDDEDEFDFT